MEVVFDNVKYVYNEGNISEKEIIKKISLSFEKGKINGIIGPNGSGKTTLIQMINGLVIPTVGEVRIDNYVVNKKIKNYKNLRFDVGLVFQFPEQQVFNLTVREEIGFALDYYNYKTENKDKRILDSLKMVELDSSYLDKNPFDLSQGELRRVAIATILAFNPKVIILDEPTIGLDSKSKNNLIKVMRLLKNRFHKTIIIVSHDVDLIHKISDYIYLISKGQLIKKGTKYEIFTDNDLLNKYHIATPKVIEFSKRVLVKKNIKLGYRDDINDLLKDIYRNVK